MHRFSPALLAQIKSRAEQHGGGFGSIFSKIARVAHKVLLSKAAGHALTAVTNYRNRKIAEQGGGGIFWTIGNFLLKGLGLA